MIYLDYAATTPISDTALAVYKEVARRRFGNPNSLHDAGSAADEVLSQCRRQLAGLLNADPRGMYFTGSGSEANLLAVCSLAFGNRHRGNHVITTPVEHPSNRQAFQLLEKAGFEVTHVPVDRYGRVRLDALEKALTPRTILVSVVAAQPEIGTVQPMEAIGRLLSEKGVLFHSDAVQAFGHMPLDVRRLRLHSVSLSSHKVYGPKGMGAVYIAPGVPWKSVFPHTTQENGFRPGTVDVAGAAAFAAAATETAERMTEETIRLRTLRDRLLSGLRALGRPVVLEGHPKERMPHHLALRFPGIDGQLLMLELNRRGIAVATGTACRKGQNEPSPAMLAVGRTPSEAGELIRITVGRHTTPDEIDRTLAAFAQVLESLPSVANRSATARRSS